MGRSLRSREVISLERGGTSTNLRVCMLFLSGAQFCSEYSFGILGGKSGGVEARAITATARSADDHHLMSGSSRPDHHLMSGSSRPAHKTGRRKLAIWLLKLAIYQFPEICNGRLFFFF